MFDILVPSNLPISVSEVKTYCKRMRTLASRFELNFKKVQEQCIQFLSSNIKYNYADYCALKSDNNPMTFWSLIVAREQIKANSDFLELLQIVLALPIRTADVERGFSILNPIKYYRRSRFTVKHLENMSRIRINGPSLSKFDAAAYALHWINSGHFESDNPRTIKRKSSDKVNIDSSLFNA